MRHVAGFSMIELLIVMCITIILVGSAAIVGVPAIRHAEFNRVRETIRAEIGAAQADAMNGTLDSMWGVAFTTTTLTRYKGSTYATRVPAFDRLTSFSDDIVLSGVKDMPFARITGTPSSTQTIGINVGGWQATTTVTGTGVIQVQ